MDSNLITFDDAYFNNPAAVYASIRASRPILRFVAPTGLEGWVVIDNVAAREILSLNRIFVKNHDTMVGDADHCSTGARSYRDRSRRRLRQLLAPWMVSHMLASEPPEHTRLRGVVQKAFSPGSIESLRPDVDQSAKALLAQMPVSGRFDLLTEFAFPLPVMIICRILGVPDRHREAIGRCSRVLSDVVVASPEQLRRASITLGRVIYPLLISRRRQPRDDLLTVLMARYTDDELTLKEVMSTVALLLIAGHETSMNLVLNAVNELLRAGAWQAFAAGRIEAGAVVAEALRFEPPLPSTTLRVAAEDFDYHGTVIKSGEVVMVSLGAANRDPAVFQDAEVFDVDRATRGSLAFGYGVHRCLGAPLAQMEGEMALTALARAYPNLSLVSVSEPGWRRSVFFRGMTHLLVTTSG